MTDVKRSDGSMDRLLIGEIFKPLVRARIVEWSSRCAQAQCGKHSGTGLCGINARLYRDYDLLSPSADSRAGIHQEEGAESTESLSQVFRVPDSLDSRDDSRGNT